MVVKRDVTLSEKSGDQYEMTKAPEDTADKKDGYDLPEYMDRLELTAEQKTRLLVEIKDELDAIKKERDEACTGGLDKKWRALESQYEGRVEEDALRQFNLCRRVTKIKCDAVERLMMKAAWKSDPKFSVTSRPEFQRKGGKGGKGGDDVCMAQQDFIDYKLDTDIPFTDPQRKVVHSSVVKGTGILKWSHEIKRERRQREECYDPSQDGEEGKTTTALQDFESAYPDWESNAQSRPFHALLVKGKKTEIVVKYEETVYNDPLPKNIELKDFYVRTATEGYEGLKTTRLIAERQTYNWWDLKREEKKEKFYDINELMYKDGDPQKRTEADKKANFANEKFAVLECTFYFKLKPDDEEEAKIKVWIAEDRWLIIGSMNYPYYAVPCEYNPHYISNIWEGFYQPGLAEALTDNNLAENHILNFTLEGALLANTVTPIADIDSPIHSQFLDKRWTHGVPMETTGGKPLDFLSKYIGNYNIQGLLTLLEFLGREDNHITGVNDPITGQIEQMDPKAPASKTIALLQQSGINIEDYIEAQIPAYNRTADIILQLYFQMSEEGRKYRPHPERISSINGANPFLVMSRQDMMTRTNIQSQARSFNFDQDNEKKEDLALYQILRQEPLVNQDPRSVYELLKTIIKGWSPKWKNQVEKLLPPLGEFQKQQAMMVSQAIIQFLQQKAQMAIQAGQQGFVESPPQMAQQLMQVVGLLQKESATPPTPEEVKAREKEAKSGVPGQ